MKCNTKAQLNIGFILAIVLLTIIIISATLSILRMVPTANEEIEKANLQAVTLDLSKILLDDPGDPADWISSPTRVGFAEFNNYTQLPVVGKLNKTKLDYVNSSMTYGDFKTSIGLNNDTDFILLIKDNISTIFYKRGIFPEKVSNVIVLNRFAVINRTQVNVTLTVW